MRACRAAQAVPRSNLQLVSVACMLVASKHEEVCTAARSPATARRAARQWRAVLTRATRAGGAPLRHGLHQHCGQLLCGARRPLPGARTYCRLHPGAIELCCIDSSATLSCAGITRPYAASLSAAGGLRGAQPGDLLKMEGLVLQSLGFHINMPTAHTFLSLLKLGLRLDARAAAAASFITARTLCQLFLESSR